jgi:ABC-type sugar transport system permease subunit
MDKIRKYHHRGEEMLAYWIFILPALFIYLLVMAFPTIVSISLSISNFNGGQLFGGKSNWQITGFQQYIRLAVDPYFWQALKNNVYIILVSVFGQIPLGFLFAYLIFRRLVKFPSFWQGVLYMPAIISTIVIGILWSTIFSPYGPIADIINNLYRMQFHDKLAAMIQSSGGFHFSDDMVKKVLALAGPQGASQFSFDDLKSVISGYTPDQYNIFLSDMTNLFAQKWNTDFLSQPNTSMLPILFVILWQWTGLYLIIFLANMQRIDVQIIESAQIDGASDGQVLRKIILPSLSGVIVTTVILAISGSLRIFDLIFSMTGGGPARVTQVLAVYTYENAFGHVPDYPLANAISTVMIIISLLLIFLTRVIENKFGGKE